MMIIIQQRLLLLQLNRLRDLSYSCIFSAWRLSDFFELTAQTKNYNKIKRPSRSGAQFLEICCGCISILWTCASHSIVTSFDCRVS